MDSIDGLGEFIDEQLQIWKVPGLAIAIVKDGEVILSQGFGKRNVDQDLEATAETLFAIGSCTKAFTTTAMGILVDEGKLDWDKPVREFLPTFKMFDPYVSDHMTPRDLVCHRSGLPRHDFMWYGAPYTRQEIFDRLQYLEPSKDFRAVWQYQNLMYMAAGHLVGQIAGCDWETFVRQRILDPLAMRSSNFSVNASQQAPDFALPYNEKDDVVRPIPFRNIDAVGPAGSINSSVSEMAQWLLLNLDKGQHEDQQIISESTLAQLHMPQMVIQEPIKHHELLHSSYGLGWFVQPYRGRLLIHHGGGIDGFSALTSFMPHDNLGVVVLTNSGTPLPFVATMNAYDRLLGLEEVAWSQRLKQEADDAKAAAEQGKGKAASDRKDGTQPSHALEEYAGEYEHPAYGVFSVELEDGQLHARFQSESSKLEHYHYDIFDFTVELWDETRKIAFFGDIKGAIDRLSIALEPAVKEIVFTRVPSKAMQSKEFLQQFEGAYELMGLAVAVALKGDDTLTATVPGQPTYELVPYRGTEFTLKGLSGFSIEFKTDAAGAVTEALFVQPNGAFTARRVGAS